MEGITSLLAILAGLLLRLAIPIAATILLIVVLRKLDTRWQAEAESQPLPVDKPECWKVNDCPPEAVKDCPGANSPLPCWQVYRLPNGYLQKECLSCKVFIGTPAPTLTH